MADERAEALEFLERLGRHPAVAFHEAAVAAEVTAILDSLGIAHSADEWGNILAKIPGMEATGSETAGAETPSDAGAAATPPLALIAHMDHPGFEILEPAGDGRWLAAVLGGVPPSSLAAGIPLLVAQPGGRRLAAVSEGAEGEGESRRLVVRLNEPAELDCPAAVVFDLPDFALDGDYIRMRAVDDLAGCAGILAALARLARRTHPPAGDIYGLFTRAEEVGLVGARLAAESGLLPPGALALSVESSRTLPGAEQGQGPVIRVGDAGYTFAADAESALIRARETLRERDAAFRCQRQLMSGGVCEASAFALYGYAATGMAFPLGNYHNGAPDGNIEAEYIHRDDYLGGIALLEETARRVADRANTAFRQRLSQISAPQRQRLAQSGIKN